jgi:hypothetical protein
MQDKTVKRIEEAIQNVKANEKSAKGKKFRDAEGRLLQGLKNMLHETTGRVYRGKKNPR